MGIDGEAGVAGGLMLLLWIGVGVGLTVGLVGMMIAVWLVIKD